MSAGILLHALALTFGEVLFGLVLVSLIAGLLFLIARAQKDGPERKRPVPVDPVDFSEEIRVFDKTRRGPEVLAGPEGRERLALTGRRMA